MPDRQINAPIEEEMRKSYLDYAMSVIVGRALPDIRDGLKPVHRRVLYTMQLLGLASNRGYTQAARVVGDCMGKVHPHGDSAIYGALVRMVQEFSLRYPLVDGQGNFGSIDGDPAAAMRYTEARMARIAHEMLADIDKDTVDFAPNYDDNETEPIVLPTRIPNLLVNGSSGIAVGMATNIPPHNLTEVVDGLMMLVDSPETTIEQLRRIAQGPVFPTRGYSYGAGGIREAYTTGRGTITLRAKAHAEKMRGGREAIIITELPYQVNKATLIEKISELSAEKKIPGISEIRDESNREGIRVVLELGRGEIPQIVMNQLYKHTQMQTTFGIIMLALVDRRPQIVNLKEMLDAFVRFRREIVTRRTRYDLTRPELLASKEEYGDARRTEILTETTELTIEDLLADEEMVVTISRAGYIKRTHVEAYRSQRRGGKGVTGMETKEEDIVEDLFVASTHSYLLFFTNRGKIHWLKVHEIPEGGRQAKGKAMVNLLSLGEGEVVATCVPVRDFAAGGYVLFATKQGTVKKTELEAYSHPRAGGIQAIGLDDDDRVMTARRTDGQREVMIATKLGMIIRFSEEEVRPMGRGAGGVKGIELDEGDEVIAADVVQEGVSILTVTERGFGKRTPLDEYRLQGRAGQGIIDIKTGGRNGNVVAMLQVRVGDDILVVTTKGKMIRFHAADVSSQGRNTWGVRIIDLETDDRVGSVARVDSESTAPVEAQ